MSTVNKITLLLITICIVLMAFGCTTKTENYAYKSVTKKDYEAKDEC